MIHLRRTFAYSSDSQLVKIMRLRWVIFNLKQTDIATTEVLETANQATSPVASVKSARFLPKNRARFVLLLTLLAFVLANLLWLLLEPAFLQVLTHSGEPNVSKIVLFNQAPHPDIVLLGTSRVYRGLDPNLIEQRIAQVAGRKISVFNLGISDSDVDISYLLLKNVIDDAHKPSLIIYGLAELELAVQHNSFETVNYLPLISRLDDNDYYKTPIEKISFGLKQFVPLYRDHEIIRDAVSMNFNSDDPNYQFYHPGLTYVDVPANGFMPKPVGSRPTSMEPRLASYGFLKYYKLDPRKVQRLRDLIELAQKRGIKLLFVNMPVTPQHLGLWESPENIQNYQNTVAQLAAQYNVPLFDLYTTASDYIPAKSFFDTNHLNLDGAEILTSLITDRYLLQMYK